jgi:GNAT superfamily N-acetyltransferase
MTVCNPRLVHHCQITAPLLLPISMATPNLSAPVLARAADLKSDLELTAQIVDLINDAFKRSKQLDPEKWSSEKPRFPTPEAYLDLLVEQAVVAMVFDRGASHNNSNSLSVESKSQSATQDQRATSGAVVACAAAVPWRGGYMKEGASQEEGWEIKAVAVSGDPKYARKGLAVQTMASLEKYLVELSKSSLQANLSKESTLGKQCRLALWVLAAECINGAYWRKRGYSEVRRSTEGEGTWNCKTSFDLVVYRRVVEVNTAI